MTKKNFIIAGKMFLVLLLVTAIISASVSIFAKPSNNTDDANSNISTSKPNTSSNPLAGKYISFLGDSITTYEGWSNSTDFNSTIGDNAVYYNSASGLSVNDTWWKQLIDKNGMRLCVNNSWSAARLTQNGVIPSAKARGENLWNDNKDIRPDIIVVYLGTNDLGHHIFTGDTFEEAFDAVSSSGMDRNDPLHMLVYTLCIMRTLYECDIFICTLLPEDRTMGNHPDLEFFNDQISAMEDFFDGVYIVDLFYDSGITYDNYREYYIDDGELCVHPNAYGMDLITRCVQNKFKEVYDF